jgi:gluconate 5-dehydrogenase
MKSENPFSLDGEIALVTGGGTGIGKAITLALTAAGAKTAIAGRRKEPLDLLAAEYPGRVFGYPYDVTNTKEAPDLLARITKEIGPPTILVNNAGVHLKKMGADVTVEEFRMILDTHILGAHALCAATIPGMKKAGRGSILYIASMAALFGIPYVTAYAAAKSAMLGIVRTLAVEYGVDGIRINAIAPGWFETEMSRKAMQGDPERVQKVINRTPLRRFGDPEDIGLAAVYLSSTAGRFITGICLPVDGGVSIGF